ncbi:sensor histidine kinase [Pseudomonadota bacterium AL_CKDN230030165-1A_HGKHYDSX7]
MQRSLRVQVLVGILGALLVSWLVQFGFYWSSHTREQSGVRDHELRTAARSIGFLLATVPPGQALQWGTSAPDRHPLQSIGPAEFQIWDLMTDKLVLSSQRAPATRMASEQSGGFVTQEVEGEPWRVYTSLDASARYEIMAGTPMRRVNEQLVSRFWLGSFVTLVMFLAIGSIAVLIVWRSLRVLNRVGADLTTRDAADEIDLDERAVPTETRPLIRAINQRQRRVLELIANERRFIGDAAHELRTPLAVLAVYADTAYRTADPEKAKLLMQKISDTTRRSTRIVEQLLDMARMDSLGSGLRFHAVDLADVARFVVCDMQSAIDEREQTLELELPSVRISGQVDALGTLMRNLLDNASRYSGNGSVLGLTIRQEAEQILLTVCDTGPGIPVAERARVFSAFYRLPGAPSHGSGIGLALVARIAALHRAAVTVTDTSEGRGACFVVRFPALT